MRYWLLAAASAMSAFALFALAGAILARVVRGLVSRPLDRAAPAPRARLLFYLRMLPILAASIAAFAVALPIFVWFEDRDTIEPLGVTLTLVALSGAWLLARGVWRAAAAWRATAAVVRRWRRQGRPIAGLGTPMPAFAIEDAFPTVAVAGIVRPRLFIAERVLREFTADEVAAMAAHECAHVAARDNARRLVMRACPDGFGLRAIERDWRAAAEEAADACAATLGPTARVDLAQALIRVARHAAPSAPQLASAFYLGGSIETRVRRLVEPREASVPPPWLRVALPVTLVLLAALVLASAPALHALMEQAVRRLP